MNASGWGFQVKAPRLVAALVAIGCLHATLAAPPLQLLSDNTPLVTRGPNVATFAPIVQKVSPSVVNIYTLKRVQQLEVVPRLRSSGGSTSELLKKLKQTRSAAQEQEEVIELEERVSSGVLISRDGFLVTNAHVVENAEKIRVGLADGSERVPKIIGVDPATDLALLKIPGDAFIPVVFGDSDKLSVGDVALTLGNPYGIGQTVSMGIISATGRGGFGILDYEDFIQTDAAINPGNSGGALVDAQGRLVGINTAIMSIGGSSQGIGFAIPANMVRNVILQLAQNGKVTRSYLGMIFLPLTSDLVKALELPTSSGVFVAGVTPGSPAAKAGIKSGDILTAVNGLPATDSRRVNAHLAHLPLDRELNLTVLAKGQKREFACKPAAEPADAKSLSGKAGGADLASSLQKLFK